MKTIKPWEVWWAEVRFEDTPEVKRRPVVITSAGDVFALALKVTSHPPRSEWGEYDLIYWQSAGLSKRSTVCIGKRLRLRHSDLAGKIGDLHPQDVINIQTIILSSKHSN